MHPEPSGWLPQGVDLLKALVGELMSRASERGGRRGCEGRECGVWGGGGGESPKVTVLPLEVGRLMGGVGPAGRGRWGSGLSLRSAVIRLSIYLSSVYLWRRKWHLPSALAWRILDGGSLVGYICSPIFFCLSVCLRIHMHLSISRLLITHLHGPLCLPVFKSVPVIHHLPASVHSPLSCQAASSFTSLCTWQVTRMFSAWLSLSCGLQP